MNITELLTLGLQYQASDLHLSAGMSPFIRVDGEMRKMALPTLTHEAVYRLICDTMDDKARQQYQQHLEIDFAFEIPGLARFRGNAFQQRRGAGAVFRVIPNRVLTLDELKAPTIFKKISESTKGLVLVTGPTGSGKTTTLAAMIDYINASRQEHVLTIEDPIEFIHESKKSLIHQREVHRDTLKFSTALRSALRADPDVILVGEVRDLETMRLALTAAETGHLVFATLHTCSATKTIDRIVDVFPGDEKAMVRSMLSESLRAVIAQILLKKIGGGRIAVHEIMICTPAIRNLIREGKISQIYSCLQTGREFGMQTLDQSLQEAVQKNKINLIEARKKTENKELFNV